MRTKLAEVGVTEPFAAVHRNLQQEALRTKSLQMTCVINVVPGAVNFIRLRALNPRQLVSLLEAVKYVGRC